MDLEQESDESNKNIDEIAYICCMYHLQVNWWFLPPPVEKAMAWASQSEIDHLDANKLENVRKFISLTIDCPIYIAILFEGDQKRTTALVFVLKRRTSSKTQSGCENVWKPSGQSMFREGPLRVPALDLPHSCFSLVGCLSFLGHICLCLVQNRAGSEKLQYINQALPSESLWYCGSQGLQPQDHNISWYLYLKQEKVSIGLFN